jgi:hypothetical protein
MLKLRSKKWLMFFAFASVALIILNLGRIQYFGIVMSAYYYQPDIEFSPSQMGAKPNYKEDSVWLSLPSRVDEADVTPEGIKSINDGSAKFDVFYVHGTGFIDSNQWTSSLKGNAATRNNAKFSLANEASIFNSCCNIFAPNYREANLFTFFGLNRKEANRVLDYVYSDIKAAFFNFVETRNQDKPFFIVSHSQGSQLIKRLLTDLNNFPHITDRIIAVYALGDAITPISQGYVDSLTYLDICKTPQATKCLVHWETIGKGGGQLIIPFSRESICINPLSWNYNEDYAHYDLHLGAATVSGKYITSSNTDNQTLDFDSPSIMPNYTKAQCKNGLLYVNDPTDSVYAKLGLFSDHAMHGVNFAIFHMNIRKNALLRAESF